MVSWIQCRKYLLAIHYHFDHLRYHSHQHHHPYQHDDHVDYYLGFGRTLLHRHPSGSGLPRTLVPSMCQDVIDNNGDDDDDANDDDLTLI